jgi:hypothetical protein
MRYLTDALAMTHGHRTPNASDFGVTLARRPFLKKASAVLGFATALTLPDFALGADAEGGKGSGYYHQTNDPRTDRRG